jgi:GWxTD domain-containing protein
MKIRNFLTAIAVTAVSATALADLSGQYLDWGRGPVQFLMTKEEAAQWKNIKNDPDAKAFVDLFWARRDPTPATPENEYRDEIEARITYADAQFNREKVRGAMTDRGRVLIVYGKPARVERVAAQQGPALDANADLQRNQERAQAIQQWTYEGDSAKEVFGIPKAQIRFVDRTGDGDVLTLEPTRVNMKKAAEKAVQISITQPNLTAAPSFAQPAAPAPVAAAPVAPAPAPVATELTTAALQTSINDLKAAEKNPYEGKAFVTTGEYVTGDGETFVPVMLFVPKSAAVPAEGLTFFGVVQDASGKNVAAFEEPAKVNTSKDDQFVEKTLAALPAGKYRGFFGLAQAGKPLAIASSEMELTGAIDKTASGASQLLLSNNLYPLTEAQNATDPYAFGGIKVVPKGDKVFRTSDELWYFFEVRNPGIPEPAADAPVSVDGQTIPTMPKLQVKVDIEGTTSDAEKKKIKMTAPPREIEAIPMKGVEGHYGVGNAIPLATFKPGDYTFTIKVIDTVKKSSYTMTDKFRVVQQ